MPGSHPLLAFSVRTPGQTAGPGQCPCGPPPHPLGPQVPQVTVITADGTVSEPDQRAWTSREGGLGDPPRASNPSSGNNVASEDGGPSDDEVSRSLEPAICASGWEIFRLAAVGQRCLRAREHPSTFQKIPLHSSSGHSSFYKPAE